MELHIDAKPLARTMKPAHERVMLNIERKKYCHMDKKANWYQGYIIHIVRMEDTK